MNTVDFANQIRIRTCEMLLERGFGHLGASLSIVEVLAVLYQRILRVNPTKPDTLERDWFVLSKGHGGPALYATLAIKGYFDEAQLHSLNQPNTNLPSHPDRNKTLGVDATTGSLGQGISQAVGIAKGLKILNLPYKVYCIVGDGEMNEGQVYEALLFAVSQKLDNFVLLLDDNKKQLDGFTKDISIQYDYEAFFKVIGFDACTVDGKDVNAIYEALITDHQLPRAIVLDTVKCQGLPYFEQLKDNHHIRFNAESSAILRSEIERLKGEFTWQKK